MEIVFGPERNGDAPNDLVYGPQDLVAGPRAERAYGSADGELVRNDIKALAGMHAAHGNDDGILERMEMGARDFDQRQDDARRNRDEIHRLVWASPVTAGSA